MKSKLGIWYLAVIPSVICGFSIGSCGKFRLLLLPACALYICCYCAYSAFYDEIRGTK